MTEGRFTEHSNIVVPVQVTSDALQFNRSLPSRADVRTEAKVYAGLAETNTR